MNHLTNLWKYGGSWSFAKLFLGSKYCATWAFAQLEYVPEPLPAAPLNWQIEFHVHAAAGCTP